MTTTSPTAAVVSEPVLTEPAPTEPAPARSRTPARARPAAPRQRRARPTAEPLLTIPPPAGLREEVVLNASRALAERMKGEDEVEQARRTVEDYGLTIEAMRLRDRLARAARTDLQRVLLSTRGIPEALFNEAIAAQLAAEQQLASPVKDTSVVAIGQGLGSASASLTESLAAIQQTTAKFQESAAAIVTHLKEVADALGGQGHPTDVEMSAQAEPYMGDSSHEAKADSKRKGSPS